MRKYYLAIHLLLFVFFSTLSAEIVEADHFDKVLVHLQHLDPKTLVIWDVDETLITPADRILHHHHSKLRNELSAQYFRDEDIESEVWLKSYIYRSAHFKLIDRRLPEIIAEMQDQNVPVIALTAMQTGNFGIIDSTEEWRYQQLKAHDIDFSGTFPDLEWEQTTQKWNRKEWSQTIIGVAKVSFRAGILYSDGPDKGVVLAAFLDKINFIPDRVIFIDDRLKYLRKVEHELEKRSIPFSGIHFRAIEKSVPEVDHSLAHRQYQVLAQEGVWLSETEAYSLLETSEI